MSVFMLVLMVICLCKPLAKLWYVDPPLDKGAVDLRVIKCVLLKISSLSWKTNVRSKCLCFGLDSPMSICEETGGLWTGGVKHPCGATHSPHLAARSFSCYGRAKTRTLCLWRPHLLSTSSLDRLFISRPVVSSSLRPRRSGWIQHNAVRPDVCSGQTYAESRRVSRCSSASLDRKL